MVMEAARLYGVISAKHCALHIPSFMSSPQAQETRFIAAFDSSSLAFHMMYSAYELNKQGDSIQPCLTLLPILNQSVVPCLAVS